MRWTCHASGPRLFLGCFPSWVLLWERTTPMKISTQWWSVRKLACLALLGCLVVAMASSSGAADDPAGAKKAPDANPAVDTPKKTSDVKPAADTSKTTTDVKPAADTGKKD